MICFLMFVIIIDYICCTVFDCICDILFLIKKTLDVFLSVFLRCCLFLLLFFYSSVIKLIKKYTVRFVLCKLKRN